MKRSAIICLVVTLTFLLNSLGPASAKNNTITPDPNILASVPPIGSPGLSFRYLETIGQGVPYLDEPYHLNSPRGLAVSGNSVLISEKVGNRVLQFGSNGNFIQKIGSGMNCFQFVLAEFCSAGINDLAPAIDGNLWVSIRGQVAKIDQSGQFILSADRNYLPGEGHSLAVDANGRLYVANLDQAGLVVFDDDGNYLKTVGEGSDDPIAFSRLGYINIYGNYLAVADAGNNRVAILDISDFNHFTVQSEITTYQVNGHTEGFNGPSSVTLDSSHIFVVDRLNHRVQVFNRNTLQFIQTLGNGGQGSGADQWNFPYDVSIAGGGNLYVSDEMNFRVQQFAPDLSWVRTFGETGVPYITDGNFVNKPMAIQADSQGNLYVAETDVHQVMKLAPDGEVLFRLGQAATPGSDSSHFAFPIGLAVDGLDNLYVADRGNNRIVVFDKNGVFLKSFDASGQLDSPNDVAVDPTSGKIIVADTNNNRILVYSNTWSQLAVIQETFVPGTGNTPLVGPRAVATDSNGNIYVHDVQYNRVSKCVLVPSPACSRLFGQPTDGNDDYQKFSTITGGLAVDSQNRVYLTLLGAGYVVVYDSGGSFVGTAPGGILPSDITFDPQGNYYVAASFEHNIHKYAPGLTDWRPVSVQQFGDANLGPSNVLVPYNGALFSAHGHPEGAQVWRMTETGEWSQFASNGFGDPLNRSITSGVEFWGTLFFGTENAVDGSNSLTGAQLYYYQSSAWQKIVDKGFSTPTNYAISSLAVFKNYLYAGTSRGDKSVVPETQLGAQIWRSGDAVNWSKVLDFEILTPGVKNSVIKDMQVFNDILYVAVNNNLTGSELWRSADGVNFTQVMGNGLGLGSNGNITSLEAYGSYLYIGGGDRSKATLWRCQTCANASDVTLVVQDGFNSQDNNVNGTIDNYGVHALLSYEGVLYALMDNEFEGSQFWLSQNGTFWERLGTDPGDSPGGGAENAPHMLTIFDDNLYLGNWLIWQLKPSLHVIKSGMGDGWVVSTLDFYSAINCGAKCWSVYQNTTDDVLLTNVRTGSTLTEICYEGTCYGPQVLFDIHVDSLSTVFFTFSNSSATRLLTVGRQGDGKGSITANTGGIDCGATCQYAYNTNTVVTLTAAATQGSFAGWSGDCTGMGACQVVMSSARNVYAAFTKNPPQVSSFSRNGVDNQPITFTGSDFSAHFQDIDGDALVKVKINSLPADGALKYAGNSVAIGQEIPFSVISSLAYQPDPGFSGEASFEWTASDGTYFAITPANVSLSIYTDADGDAVGDPIEAAAPPLLNGGLAGDGNGDGINDSNQPNVASQVSTPGLSLGSNVMAIEIRPNGPVTVDQPALPYFTLAAPAGNNLTQVRPFTYAPGNPGSPEPFAYFPLGFVQFHVAAGQIGNTLTAHLYYAGTALPESIYVFGLTIGNAVPHWYKFMYDGATGAVSEKLPNNKIKITLYFIDGGRGDNDLSKNGAIVSFVGPVMTQKLTYFPVVNR